MLNQPPDTARFLAAHEAHGLTGLLVTIVAELAVILAPVAPEQRYRVGLDWLDQVHEQLAEARVNVPPVTFLRLLIAAGGDQLDQTVFLPTGLQQITLN